MAIDRPPDALGLMGQTWRNFQLRILDLVEQRISARMQGITAGGGSITSAALPDGTVVLSDDFQPSDPGDIAYYDGTQWILVAVADPGDLIYFDGTDWVVLSADSDGQVLTLSSSTPTWSGGYPGYAPVAYALGLGYSQVPTTALSLAANGGSVAFPVAVVGNMLLQSLTLYSTDIVLARSCEWRLYQDTLDSTNSLTEVSSANGTLSFTPTVASIRTSTPGSPPISLVPGAYWLVVRNTHATNTFGIGTVPAGTLSTQNGAQTKTLGSALGSTLDFVAITWTKVQQIPGVALNGRSFGQSSSF